MQTNFLVFTQTLGNKYVLHDEHAQSLRNDFNLFTLPFNVFDYLARTFTISTNNGSYKFNINMLKDTSSVIFKALTTNPQLLEYHIDLNDEKNVMGKIELLYQGIEVKFNDSELFFTQKISELLNITCFPDFMKPLNLAYNNQFFNRLTPKNYQVILQRSSLIRFLQNDINMESFTIKVNDKVYHTNIYGVRSSKKINYLLEKSPQLRFFE